MRERIISALVLTGCSASIISTVALVIPIVEKPIAMVGLMVLGGVGILAVAQRLGSKPTTGGAQAGAGNANPAN
jgi:hypothetical protein